MKKLRYILAILFSSLIIISGVGVSIMHYCCAGCETTQSCCATGCAKCDKSHHSSQETCKDTGCTAVHYKVDLVKYAQETLPFVPPIAFFCEQLPQLCCFLPADNRVTVAYESAPPLSVSSRQYLALYSVLLI